MSHSGGRRRWYQRKRWVILSLLVFPPLGIVLVWLTRWPRWVKIASTMASSLILLAALTSESPEPQVSHTSLPSTDGVQTETSGVAPTPEIVASPNLSPTPEPKPEAAPEPFRVAVNHATEAVNLGQSAQTSDDWKKAAGQWQSAVASLEDVPTDSTYYGVSQAKLTEYRANLAYAQQQEEQSRLAEIAEVERQRQQAAEPKPGEPIRASRSGQGCDCPYDIDRAGRRCGRRSAYSKPGGRAPVCYVGE